MKIIRNSIIPFKGFKAMNFFGILFVRKEATMRENDFRHEAIHTEQIKELKYIGYYPVYIYFWVRNLFRYGFSHKAYRMIPFEREAYDNENVTLYLEYRTKYAWKYYGE